ncbi:oligoribonuclease [Ferrithrix thermotolerans DSM 19514]|uniref:Oligoribonuclease n=2 Tax=Ferrithrix TaxID=643949 RepID=A0A1M4S4V8_9ACTN|nr:oligoribonuclease [Ferrithrix thermotolerans DSM 19514]
MIWMDLEMTGLDPKRHVIVEIATLITDFELNVVAEGPDLVISATAEQLAEMDEVVTAMHRRSGLLSEIAFSNTDLQEAQEATLDFIKGHIKEPRSAPLCGNSIGTDRRFLEEYMPKVEEYLHYRNIDVSSIKELAKRWYPGIMKHAPTKQMGHRALDDIRESIAELEFYRSSIFRDTPVYSDESEPSLEG